MKNIINPIEISSYKVYPILIAVMASLQMLSIIYGRKFIMFLGLNVAINSVLFVPSILYLFQIVTEVCGWQYGRQIVWCNFIFNSIVTLFLFGIRYVKSSSITHLDIEYSYSHFVNTLWVSAALNWGLIFTVDYISSVLMNYMKNKFKGYFLLYRMLAIHILAELILSVGSFIALPYNGYSINETLHVVFNTVIARAIACTIIAPMAVLIIKFIQSHLEKIIVFDSGDNFWNIFKLAIKDRQTIRFKYEDWNKLTEEQKKIIDLNQLTVDYHSSHATIRIKKMYN